MDESGIGFSPDCRRDEDLSAETPATFERIERLNLERPPNHSIFSLSSRRQLKFPPKSRNQMNIATAILRPVKLLGSLRPTVRPIGLFALSSLFLVAMHLLLEAMHLFLVAYCF